MHSIPYFFKKSFDLAKKASIILVVFLGIFLLFGYFLSKNTKAPLSTTDLIKKNRQDIQKLLGNKELQKTKEGRLSLSVLRYTSCSLTGEACFANSTISANDNYQKSLFGQLTGLIIFPFTTPPASGTYWVYSGLQQAGFISNSYAAQGVGFSAIQPISNIWKLFRDVAYLLLVIVLVLIGFMIMFRMKINQQTVISLENALPRIVLSLILITFSFAIAGFLIDMMYVALALGINILSKNTIIHIDAATYQHEFFSGGPGKLFNEIFFHDNFWSIGQAIFNILPAALNITLRVILGGLAYWAVLKNIPFIGPVLGGDILDNIIELGKVPATIAQGLFAIILIPLIAILSPFILSLVVMLTGLFVFFRILFLLLKSYIFILLLIIFSPIMLLFVAIPGRNAFSAWLKNLISNLLVFPTVAMLLIIALIITAIPAASGNFWRPPFLYGMDPNAISVIIGVLILFLIPELVKKLRELIGIKDAGLPFSVGALFGGVGAVGKTATGGVQRYFQYGYYAQQMIPEDLQNKLSGIPFVGGLFKGKSRS